MPRRLCSLALALVSSTAMMVEPAMAAPPPTEGPVEGPVEGPAPPPSEPNSEPTSDPVAIPPPSLPPGFGDGSGIEFATPPSEMGTVPPPSTLASPQLEIGKAPTSGGSFLAAGLWIVPASAWGTTVLLLNNRATQYRPATTAPGIITAGAGLGAIGLSMIAVGIVRQVRLKRWATRHRVIALPQGSGLMTSGTLAALFGVIALVSIQDPVSIAVGTAMLISAPIQLGVGISWSIRYRRTDGWRRTRYTLGPGGFRMQF